MTTFGEWLWPITARRPRRRRRSSSVGGLTSGPSFSSRFLPRLARGHGGLEHFHGAEAERHRVARLDVGRVPMRALAHRTDRRLRGADQFRDLAVAQFGMILHKPRDRVGLVLALGDRRIARALRFTSSTGCACLAICSPRRPGLFWHRSISSRVSWPLAMGSSPTICTATSPSAIACTSSALRPQNSPIWSKPQRRVLYQPHGGRLGHQRQSHRSSSIREVAQCDPSTFWGDSRYIVAGTPPGKGPIAEPSPGFGAQTVSMILPIWLEVSSRRCASPASVNGKVL